MRRRRSRRDDGTVLLLVVGFGLVLMALVGVVADVSAVLLAKRGVASAADGAAVAAAQQLDEDAFYSGGVGERVPLSSQQVANAVAQYAAALPGLQLQGSVEGGTVAVVRAERVVRLPVTGWLTRDRVTVRAVARARSPVLG